MANLSLLLTCLALFSLVSNFCFGLNPNDWGLGWGPGSGWGSGSSPGYGSKPGSPDYGSPPDYGSGSPPGSGSDLPPGSGSNSPPGYGSGSPPGYGSGSPPGSGSNSPPGYGSGLPPGYGSGSPPGYGSGSPPGYGSGSPPGYGSGSPPGSGSDSLSPPGYGSGSPPSGSGSPPGSGSEAGWSTDRATFYGSPTGSGNEDGGACGFGSLSLPPFSSVVSSVNNPIFGDNKRGCGHCYQVKCSIENLCSPEPVTVTITDSSLDIDHLFDLSGTAFGKMAIPGKEDQLRSKGIVDIQYKKVDCNYKGANVAFRVDKTSNQYYFAMAVQYFNGDGLTGVELRRANTNDAWLAMKISWGGVYRVNLPAGYGPPFSVRLTQSSKTVVAENVIPANYDITIYKSNVNF